MRGSHNKVETNLATNSQDQNTEQRPKLFRFELRSKGCTQLRTDHAADNQDQCQQDIHRLVIYGLQKSYVGSHKDNLKKRGTNNDLRRHTEQIDHCRHHDKTTANTHNCRQDSDKDANREGQ